MGNSIRIGLAVVLACLVWQCSDKPTAPNRSPYLASIAPQTVQEGSRLEFIVQATDSDGVIPTISATNLPTNASAVDSGNGTLLFVFEPDFTQSGIYDVTFIAFDGRLTDSQTVTITVTPYSVGEAWPMAVGNYWVYETNEWWDSLSSTTDGIHAKPSDTSIDSIHVQSGSQVNGAISWKLLVKGSVFSMIGDDVTIRDDSIIGAYHAFAIPSYWSIHPDTVQAGVFDATFTDCEGHGLTPHYGECLVFAKDIGVIETHNSVCWSWKCHSSVSRLVRYHIK
jgi:hypothetical protein